MPPWHNYAMAKRGRRASSEERVRAADGSVGPADDGTPGTDRGVRSTAAQFRVRTVDTEAGARSDPPAVQGEPVRSECRADPEEAWPFPATAAVPRSSAEPRTG